MPRAARQARRPLQLIGLAPSYVWEAENSSEEAPTQPTPAFDCRHNYLARLQPILPPGAKGEDMLEMFGFFLSKRTGRECSPWSISSGQQDRGERQSRADRHTEKCYN